LGAIVAGKKVTELDPTFNNPLSYVAKVQTDNLVEEQRRSAKPPAEAETGKPLSEIPLLADLAPSELEAVAENMRVHEMDEGDVIFQEGDGGDSLFFVTRGSVVVDTNAQKLAHLGPGGCFGEFSFLTGKRRIASVRTLDRTELLELSASDVKELMGSHPRLREVLFKMYRERAMVNVLARSPLFHLLGAGDREKVAAQMELVIFEAHQEVIHRGTSGASLFLIKSGSVEVRGEGPGGEELKLATLGPHQFFGEVSFLTGVPRTATITTLEECELLKLPDEVLRQLVKDYPGLKETLERYHFDRVMATAETMKTFLRKGWVEGILSPEAT
jgi:CRP-like cAMP-binding protein